MSHIAPEQLQKASQLLARMQADIERVVIGQKSTVRDVLISLLAGGHVLIEGVPGVGKTLLVRCLARAVTCDFSRIQFTPDLMPADITGHALYNMKEEQFVVRRGPVFTNFLLADEINRAPAKTQAALLEVMQERQVTIENESLATGDPFMVLATQNPIEHEGTYPLPEAELDRFIMKIQMQYPAYEDERNLVRQSTQQTTADYSGLESLQPVCQAAHLIQLQKMASNVLVDERVQEYAVQLVRATRETAGIARGAGPRGSIALLRTAKALALLEGRDFITPDDVRTTLPGVLRHRIALTADRQIEGRTPDELLLAVIESVAAPRL
jgi:MoxR-like ATPase